MNQTGRIAFFLFLIAYALFWVTIICNGIPKEERRKHQPKYDERQVAAQGRASTYAYTTLIVYLLLYSLLDAGFDFVWCEQVFGIFLGIIFSLSVYLAFCIFQDAYFGVGDKKPGVLLGANIFGFSQLILSIECFKDGTIVENGIICAEGLHLVVVIFILLLDAFVMIRNRMDKHAS